jgi:3-hydroxyisobutyrate dehydrogenase
MVSVINGSTGRSQSSEVKYPKHILTGTFDSGFAMDLMLKDLAIARRLIEEQDVIAPIILTTEELARTARAMLDSTAPDHTEFVKYFEHENDQSLRAEQ